MKRISKKYLIIIGILVVLLVGAIVGHGYWSGAGSCWWCSNMTAQLSTNGWYDSNYYYRYYNTCSCSTPYCGASGYRRNDYCPYNHGYPSVSISYKNDKGLVSYSAVCSRCSYSVHY